MLHVLVRVEMSSIERRLALLSGLAGLLAAYGLTRWWWSRPVRDLHDLIAAVRAGDAPIEALSDVGRGARPIVPLLQEVLRDLRQQRRELATLNEEMRQRIAHRTDALERTIGTLRHQATRDALTGLFNRRFLEGYLPQVVQRCREQRADVAVLMGDLDHFKLLNDTLGHAAGDALLRSIGQLIRSTIRGEDAAFRMGGDEFLIVMPGSTCEHGRALGERLASLADALGRTINAKEPPRLSCGVASIAELPDPSATTLLGLADERLYVCKRTRRDTIAATDANALQPAGRSVQCSAQ